MADQRRIDPSSDIESIARPTAKPQAAAWFAEVAARQRKARDTLDVVIVDDSVTSLKVLANTLAQMPGVTIRTYQSSAKALEACTAIPPDLIVIDHRMPPPDGLTFIKEYAKVRRAAGTPIVMITGEQDREIRRQALDAGASDFLTKPADPFEFLARVRNLLTTVKLRHELEQRTLLISQAASQALRGAASDDVETINLLMRAVESRENPSGMHVIRMGQYAALLGAWIDLSDQEQRILMQAAPMHDIGKVGIPDAVLLKPDTLTPSEFEVIRQHPTVGYDILKGGTSAVLKAAAQIAKSHHERWNGEGYPDGIAGEAIPLPARICAVADAFDAMLCERPYRRARRPEQVFEELRTHAGVFYDPGIVRVALAHEVELLAVAGRLADNAFAP